MGTAGVLILGDTLVFLVLFTLPVVLVGAAGISSGALPSRSLCSVPVSSSSSACVVSEIAVVLDLTPEVLATAAAAATAAALWRVFLVGRGGI